MLMAIAVVAGSWSPITLGSAPSAQAASTSVVRRYAPVVRLAKGEPWRPMSAASFIDDSSLRWAHDVDCPDHEEAARGDIDDARLGSGGYSHQAADGLIPTGCPHEGPAYPSDDFTRPRDDGHGRNNSPPTNEGFFLEFDDGLRDGEGVRSPVYYEYKEKAYITYWFFYAFNDAPTRFVDHEGDWERISLRLDDTNRPDRIAFFQHDGGPCILPWTSRNLQKRGSHPVVFSAKGTHASYPKAGSFDVFGPDWFTDDKTSHGSTWSTYRSLVDARAQGWFNFGGAWGEVGEAAGSTGPLGPSAAKGAVPGNWDLECNDV